MQNKIFAISAAGDTLYVSGTTPEKAKEKLFTYTGTIPEHLLEIKELTAAPEGEDVL